MPKFRQNFKKTVWGFFEVDASSEEEAQAKFNNSDFEEFDNESEYETEEWKKQD